MRSGRGGRLCLHHGLLVLLEVFPNHGPWESEQIWRDRESWREGQIGGESWYWGPCQSCSGTGCPWSIRRLLSLGLLLVRICFHGSPLHLLRAPRFVVHALFGYLFHSKFHSKRDRLWLLQTLARILQRRGIPPNVQLQGFPGCPVRPHIVCVLTND